MAKRKLLHTIQTLSQLLDDRFLEEPQILEKASALIKALVATDDWLPEEMAQPHPKYYQQHLLYGDPHERFSLVSFVWGPGQETPIHDHTVWGVIGMLRGAENDQSYRRIGSEVEPIGDVVRLNPGDVVCVSPTIGDIHKVSNAYKDQVSISIHLYGGNIGSVRRSVYDLETGASKEFVSGYSNTLTPNLWS